MQTLLKLKIPFVMKSEDKTQIRRKKPPYVKSQAVKDLEVMADQDARMKHPDMPFLAPRKFRDDSANSLTKCITTYLRLKGAFVSRINNTGIYDKQLQRFRPGTSRKGLPDVVCTWRGKSIMIEVKHGRDRMSEHQERIKQEQERSGGLFFICHSFDEFKGYFDKI